MRAKCHNFFYYHYYSTDSLRNATPLGRKRIEYYFIARTQKGISNNSILKLEALHHLYAYGRLK